MKKEGLFEMMDIHPSFLTEHKCELIKTSCGVPLAPVKTFIKGAGEVDQWLAAHTPLSEDLSSVLFTVEGLCPDSS